MSYASAPYIILAIAVILVLCGAFILLKQKWFWAWLKGTAGIVFIIIAAYISLLAFNLMSYQALVQDTAIANVSLRQTAPQKYIAIVTETNGDSQQFELQGDLWQLDARIIKWKTLFSLLGIKPGYRLDRIEGRYLTLEDERFKPHTVHQIHQPAIGFDIWEQAKNGFSLLVDARYGSATYLPMADGASYEVSLSATGLVGRPLNDAANKALYQW